MRVMFNKPPLEEVIVGATPAQPIPLRADTLGFSGPKFGKDFTVIQQQLRSWLRLSARCSPPVLQAPVRCIPRRDSG